MSAHRRLGDTYEMKQVTDKKGWLKEKIGTPLAVIVLFVCGFLFWGILVGLLVQEFSDFANAPFYSGLSEHFRDASFADFIPVLLFTCVCVILIFLMFWRRYRPTSQPYDGIPSPHMHPAVASYAMRGGFFDPNRIIALTVIHLAHRKILFASDKKCAWNKEWRSALNGDELSEIDYAVMRFLERVYFYIDKKEERGRKGCVLYFDEINDFSHRDRKIYNDLVTDIKQAFSTQCAREGVKENRGNLLTAITFLVIVGAFIVGILALFISTFVIGDSSVLSGATIFFYSLPFVLCAIPLFIVALVVLSPGLPWDTNAGQQAAAFYEAVRTSSFPEITNEIDERWAGLTIVDKNSADCPFEVKIDARAIYENLPVIGMRKWISPLNRWARVFFIKSQKIRKSPKKIRENTQKARATDLWGDLLGVAGVFAVVSFIFLVPALISLDTRDKQKEREWLTNVSWHETLFASRLFHYVLAPILLGILLFILARFLYFLVNYGRLAFSRSKEKYSREVPDIHPATASIIASGGVFRIKRVLSSSLLRLVSLDVFTIEKRENEYGKSSFVFMRAKEEKSRVAKIDKAVLKLVDFVIADRYEKRARARSEELKDYELSGKAEGVAFLEDFPVVSKKEPEEYVSYIKEIFNAISEDLEKHQLRSKILKRIDSVFKWSGTILVFIVPLLSMSLFTLGDTSSATSGYLGSFLTLFYAFWVFANPVLFLVFYEVIFDDHILFSNTGIAVWKDLRGLRRWFEDYTLLEERDVLSVKVWEEYMVYAAALGLPARVYDDFSQAIETADSVYCDLAKDLDETL